MLLRKRERFERTDVPSYGPHSNAIAVGVLLAIAIFLVVLVGSLWKKANDAATLNDKRLTASLGSQADVRDPEEGYRVSDDRFMNLLVLTVDNASATSPTLHAAQLLSLNVTAGTGSLVSLPLNTKLAGDAGDTTLEALFAQVGPSALPAPLSAATNVSLGHVLVAPDGTAERLEGMKGRGVSAILGSAPSVLTTINTDMGTGQLLDLAELIQSIGVDNISRADAVASQEEDGSGGVRSVLDQTQLGVALGILVPAE